MTATRSQWTHVQLFDAVGVSPVLAEATRDDLSKLLKRLHPDREVAWGMYILIWEKLVMYFQRHNCTPSSDRAHDALSRIARRDDLDEIRNIAAFAYGVARKMMRETSIRETSLETLPESVVSNWASVQIEPAEGVDRQRQLQCIRRCLEELPTNDRVVFLSFELADGAVRMRQRKKLAMKAGVSVGAFRVRVFRIRRDIERCARTCMANWGVRPD
jgi:DNA-directed RNA polymerase specialized sigma24 family protein